MKTETLRPGRTLAVLRLEPTGPASGTTVVLVHGSGGRSAQWRLVWPALQAAGHRVLAFDALGHGESPAPRDWAAYAGPEWAADLQALLQHDDDAGRVLLVGHSYGCLVVLAALSAGLPAQGALLLAPPPYWAAPRAPWFTYLPLPLLERLRPGLSKAFRSAAWSPRADPALVDEETAISDRNPLHVIKALWRQRLAFGADELDRVRVPVRLLAGEDDRLTPPHLADALAGALVGARVQRIAGAGHQLPLEAPQAVVDAVLALVARPVAAQAA